MAIFRAAKTQDYTVMSNYHLRDRTLTLKAKGLLSPSCSCQRTGTIQRAGWLPSARKAWTALVRPCASDLESAGYFAHHRLRNKSGRISDTEYVVYEIPHKETDVPDVGFPDTETPVQFYTDILNMYESNTPKSNSPPILTQKQNAQQADTGMGDMDRMDARESQRTLAEVKAQIEYDAPDTSRDHECLDEIVEIMTKTLCSASPISRSQERITLLRWSRAG